MPIQGRDFDSGYTVGETKALIAPLFNTDAAHIKSYVVMIIGETDDMPMLSLVSNDQHVSCRIGMLANAIQFLAADPNTDLDDA